MSKDVQQKVGTGNWTGWERRARLPSRNLKFNILNVIYHRTNHKKEKNKVKEAVFSIFERFRHITHSHSTEDSSLISHNARRNRKCWSEKERWMMRLFSECSMKEDAITSNSSLQLLRLPHPSSNLSLSMWYIYHAPTFVRFHLLPFSFLADTIHFASQRFARNLDESNMHISVEI